MKNPRLSSAALSSAAAAPVIPPGPLSMLEAKNDDLTKVLQFLKFSPDEIGRITSLVSTVGKLASTANWVIGGISTVKSLLTAIGLLDKEEDATRKLLESIAARVETIYHYLLNDARRQLYVQAAGWRKSVRGIRTSIADAGKSRSQEIINSLIDDSKDLQGAIDEMLDLSMAEITYDRVSQAYQATWPPSHWIDAASPFYMETMSGPLAIDLHAESSQLGKTIWDPGYYLDLLFEGIGVRIAALTALEPAFRSTGYRRTDLVEIHRDLQPFIQKWAGSLLRTRVVGPIDPQEWPHTVSGGLGAIGVMATGHYLSHPAKWPTQSIVLGIVDPASGIAELDWDHKEAFALAEVQDFHNVPGGPTATYWILTNYDQAVGVALSRREAMRARVTAECGINRAWELWYHLGSLINPPASGSEFVDITDAEFGSGDLKPTDQPEHVELGIIGHFAGKAGKQYRADRFHWYTVKKFRIPMARRMDVSGIQLGYRVEIDLGNPEAVSTTLCEYSPQTSTTLENKLPLFPTGEPAWTMKSPNATVYDVLQSAKFSIAEEEMFERDGRVPGKRRLLLNSRTGPAEVSVEVSYEFDVNNPAHSFIGYANVEIGAPDRWPNSHGFICSVRVFETRMDYVNGADVVQEVLADSVRLHFCPSFLVVEPDYFTDRDIGVAAMNKMFHEVSDRFAKSLALQNPRDPIERIGRIAVDDEVAKAAYAELAREEPQFAQSLLRRYAAPSAQPPG
jgi:hypothetical protein